MNRINENDITVIKKLHENGSYPESSVKAFVIFLLASGKICSKPTAKNNPPENADDKDNTSGLDLNDFERNGRFPVIMIIENITTIASTFITQTIFM